MMLGVAGTQLIGLAAHFGIADLLRDGPKPIGTPAEATGTREQALLQAMRVLAALGIFAEPQPRQFVNTPLGDLLRFRRTELASWLCCAGVQRDDSSGLG